VKSREQKPKTDDPSNLRDNVVSLASRRKTEAARKERDAARANRLPVLRMPDDDSDPPAA
jgi:hypothetical protein